MSFEIKTYNAIMQDMQAWIIANQNKVTDFNEGGVLTSMLEAFARQLEQLYIRTKVNFEKYFLEMPYAVFGIQRKGGLKASGTVVFSRNSPSSNSVTIPSGTRIATSSGIMFVTTQEGQIPANQTVSNQVSIQAEVVGKDSNVPSGAISVIVYPISGVDAVTNYNPIVGGQDDETDDEFLKRFREYLLGLGRVSKHGLITAAKSVNGVRSATVVEHFPPLNGVYHCTLYIDDGSGDAPAWLISEVQRKVEGDGTVENPGYRCPGVMIRFIAPVKVVVDVSVTVTVVPGSVDKEQLKYLVKQVITEYINGLSIGEDVVLNRIVRVVMGQQGVYDIIVTAPTGNILISDSQIARAGNIEVTVP
mgnify:CR=1 FL=1